MSADAIPSDVALSMQLVILGSTREPEGGYVETRAFKGRRVAQDFFACDDHAGVARTVRQLSNEGWNVSVGAAPRRRREGKNDAVERIWCLWADCDSVESVEQLRAFRPKPHLVLKSGRPEGGRHAYWELREPASPAVARTALKRLALHLGSDPQVSDAARVMRAAGSLNHKYDPPVEVEATYLDVAAPVLTVAEVLATVPELTSPEPERTVGRIRLRSVHSPFADVLLSVPASEYIPALTGREIVGSKVRCPFHGGGEERTPSLHIYGDDAGWSCFGGCPAPPGRDHFGGDIYTFGAALYGLDAKTDFPELRRRLAEALGVAKGAAA